MSKVRARAPRQIQTGLLAGSLQSFGLREPLISYPQYGLSPRESREYWPQWRRLKYSAIGATAAASVGIVIAFLGGSHTNWESCETAVNAAHVVVKDVKDNCPVLVSDSIGEAQELTAAQVRDVRRDFGAAEHRHDLDVLRHEAIYAGIGAVAGAAISLMPNRKQPA